MIQNVLKMAAAGSGGGAVLILGSLLMEVEDLKRDMHMAQMDMRLYEAKLNECLSRQIPDKLRVPGKLR